MTLADHIGLLKYLDKENDKKLAESPNDLFLLICTLNRQCHCTINRPEIRNNMQKYAQYIILSNQHFADCYS